MRIGLVDVDGHNFPNLALMKLSAWHKANGDAVEWADPMFGRYDIVYQSKVFTSTPDDTNYYHADQIIKAGTGYRDYTTVLPDEIEHICPDYLLYPRSKHYDQLTAYGFLTRGCIRRCPWCIVPKKEGRIARHTDIEEFLGSHRKAVLLDNNVLACEWGISQVEKIADMKIRVDFNQGLDARLITRGVANLLARVKWIKRIRVACDKSSDIPVIERTQKLLKNAGYNGEIGCYTLIDDFQESFERINYLRRYKWFIPHAQPYQDFDGTVIQRKQADLARWANRKELFRSCEFRDYEPRKGFFCRDYFNQ